MTTALSSARTKTLPVSDRLLMHIPLYKVLLHNDDTNTMEHVVKSLRTVFGFEQNQCELIMNEAHRNGVALCIVESLEQAEHHQEQLRACSLIATIEPE